ncbi:hypothetical protein GCM10023219_14530 [Stakelama sediminis]|uniref:Putative surface protein with fasciclin (FAS1) repeats n=1 Tax=Stakelama sediminis TaxID=463200 RepID=A0A840YWZ0_9SPHN|nr:fasciclin domain-containing protein [Stakelama sediminis]MBB5718178.1 putative surface protein with fasciclin (FAS1) repeats [Stakelama sediminis]
MRTIAVAMTAGLLMLAGCSGNDNGNSAATNNSAATTVPSDNLVQALDGADNLDSFSDLVKKAGLDKALSGNASYTIFAPTDQAIDALPKDERDTLNSDAGRPKLIALLRQHIATGYVEMGDLQKGLSSDKGKVTLATMSGNAITLDKSGNAIAIGSGSDAPQIAGDPIRASNGVIYPISKVIPPQADAN